MKTSRDLFSRVDVGTRVVVLPKNGPHLAARAIGPAGLQAAGTITVRPAVSPGAGAPAGLSGRQATNLSMSSLY